MPPPILNNTSIVENVRKGPRGFLALMDREAILMGKKGSRRWCLAYMATNAEVEDNSLYDMNQVVDWQLNKEG